jgi:copper chaperone CopZ
MKHFSLLAALLFLTVMAMAKSTLNLTVKGMHCSGCETKFKTAAAGIKGIEAVNEVSASTGTAVIVFDEKAISAEEAIKALAEKSGFTVSASSNGTTVTANGKPSGCCMDGKSNASCKKARAKAAKSKEAQ